MKLVGVLSDLRHRNCDPTVNAVRAEREPCSLGGHESVALAMTQFQQLQLMDY
ncbi:MAG: hypothetical protein Q7T25_03865 [Sideroxyarcus sp.]|nr:hypothetical protein [Sideroxyarcus sp.]